MMEKRTYLFCCFILIAAVFLAGCAGQEKTAPKAVIVSDPKEYFPLTGMWSYRIESGNVDALTYQASTGLIQRISINKSRFQGRADGCYLKLKVIKYSLLESGNEGSILAITRDDPGLFGDTSFIYWILFRDEGFVVDQMIFYNYYNPAVKPVFFLPSSGESNQKVNFVVGPEETLTYLGLDDKAPGCQDYSCLKFIREVRPGSGKYGYTDKGFLEYQWFAKGKGLVFLQQTVDGQVSMTWTLEQYVGG